jgi:AraC family transcriptional activator of pobA
MMDKAQSIEEFYKAKLTWIPDNLKKEMGHFNVFELDDFVGCHAKPVPYSRKDFYKISLIEGRNNIFYADKTVVIDEFAILFANPQVPYNWESLDDEQSGFFCIFTEEFFQQYGNFKAYPVFKPGADAVYTLNAEQRQEIRKIFSRMFEEISSDYVYKYDVLRSLVFEIIHSALKFKPAQSNPVGKQKAAVRVASLFIELLERQFPIESPMQQMKLRTPADFADHLCIHVNHLNRSLKEVTEKTTSQLIAERVLQEARALLKHTNWNISEIAWCLGFEELPHFIHFFKKNVQLTPGSFRST